MPFEGPLPVAATFSKDPKFWGRDFEPKSLLYGDGACVYGSDGHDYLDWVSALGANLLGYASKADGSPQFDWLNQVQLALNDGAAFSLPHTLERQVAEKLVALLQPHVPGWKNQPLGVRFGLSGTDATTMAVRLARAVTGREWVLSVGYHGWSSEFVAGTPPAWGVVQNQWVGSAPFGTDLTQALAGPKVRGLQLGHVAALIIEQTVEDPPPGYWQQVRRLCTEYGTLLILDEVVTGLRFALGGAAELYGIEPDIVCMAKALGNGIPISCMVGRREYFDWFSRNDPVFVSSTGFGNAVSLAAADAVLDLWSQAGVDHLWTIGRALLDGLCGAGYDVIGQPPRSLLRFATGAERGYFIAGMRDRGILVNRPNIPNLAHTLADVARTVAAAAEVKAEMGRVNVAEVMCGKEPAVLFEGR